MVKSRSVHGRLFAVRESERGAYHIVLLLEELEPSWKMMMFERLGAPGEESSNGFNNAGRVFARDWQKIDCQQLIH